MVPPPAALRMHHPLDEADMAVTGAVIVRAVDIAGLVGVSMVPAMIGDPFEHRALHRHRSDRGEQRPHDRTAAEAAVDEVAMHEADADGGHHKRADEDRNLDPANALREAPDQRPDRTCDHHAERDIGIEKLGVYHRAFDKHAPYWWHFPVRTLLRHHALNCGHFN